MTCEIEKKKNNESDDSPSARGERDFFLWFSRREVEN